MNEEVAEIATDVLVIGSEGAGARAAIEADQCGAKVVMATKGLFGGSGATLQGVYSCCAAFGHADPRDNPEVHMRDTIIGGRYLNNQKMVEMFTYNAPQQILELERFGAKFEKEGDGRFKQGWLPGHTYSRCVYWDMATGLQFRNGLTQEVRRRDIKVLEDFLILELLKADGRVAGALGLDIRQGKLVAIRAKATVLATGGCMELFYPHSDAAAELTGDGLALALRAGADLHNMEFQQFLPAAVIWPPALRGFINITILRYHLGAKLYNKYGERFMRKIDPERMERSTRDLVSRGMGIEILEGRGSPHGGVWQDVSFLPANIIDAWLEDPLYSSPGPYCVKQVLDAGVDFYKEAVEVAPVAHFLVGGIKVTERCETRVPGLFAAGEVTAGVNGANRIEGNALPETQVFGWVAGQSSAGFAKSTDLPALDRKHIKEVAEPYLRPLHREKGQQHFEFRSGLQELMWKSVGLVRDESGLTKAVEQFKSWRSDVAGSLLVKYKGKFNKEWAEAVETMNMLLVGQVMAASALSRRETRGVHFRQDHPRENEDFVVLTRAQLVGDEVAIDQEPVIVTRYSPGFDKAEAQAGESVKEGVAAVDG